MFAAHGAIIRSFTIVGILAFLLFRLLVAAIRVIEISSGMMASTDRPNVNCTAANLSTIDTG